ncbi:ankyrin repeat domain-containing protein [Actinomadura macra]|uniref:ankyrin repeat domain-containing protein n=1 Tax=Actinomadura macra TaxID=46164 RepID=UPI000834AFED|nr:ankyrin repeat domain-containing protein [Actinomadura macra]
MIGAPSREELAAYRRIRRYAVPRSMIEKATARRLAGDWHGACAAANVDVAFDLDGVAGEYGAEAAAELADDLRHFAPDLLRWHLPRVSGGGRTGLVARLSLALGRYGGDRAPAPAPVLHVDTPALLCGPQRLTLAVRPWSPGARDWTSAPHLFDARRAGDLLRHSALAVTTGGGRRRPLARLAHEDAASAENPELEEHQGRRLPDLDLLRAGMITPAELHPLVSAALFPARPVPDRPDGPPGVERPAAVRVRCRGEWHEVRSGHGGLEMPHSAAEQRREQALAGFGGKIPGCFAVHRVWRSGDGRLPRGLREQREDLFLRAQHGDTDGVLRLLDAGMDPFVRDGRRRTLMHTLSALDHEVLLPRLLEAGLGLEDLDHNTRTPLYAAVCEIGPVALIRALVEAGARTDTTDRYGRSLTEMIKSNGRDDLEWLRAG